MKFKEKPLSSDNWFSEPEPVACKIHWTEAPNSQIWTGHVARIENISADTRTFNIAIKITKEEAHATIPGQHPLADGLFCSVKIPGKILRHVIRVPREAVTLDSNVYIDAKGKLKSVAVKTAWSDKSFFYITDGLKDDDIVIITRLIAPIENSLLNTTIIQPEKQ